FTLMYPMMIGFVANQQIKRATKPERDGVEIAVVGASQAPTLMAQLKQRNINVKDVGALDEPAITDLLQARKFPVVLRLSDKFTENYAAMRPARVELWYD